MPGTTVDLLWYNVFATNDATAKLGGNPFGNRLRWYSGSGHDFLLNTLVERFTADPAALDAMNAYQTSGNLQKPLVTIHTKGDQIVPFWHEILYLLKANPHDGGHLTQIPIFTYGHCNFTTDQLLAAFGILYLQVRGSQPAGLKQQFNLQQIERDWQQAKQQATAPPVDRAPETPNPEN